MSNAAQTAQQLPIKERKQILIPRDKLDHLEDMYLIRSYTGFEDPMREHITNILNELNIPYINLNGNILGLNHPGAPLFSAHMDMVNTDGYKLHGKEDRLQDYTFTVDSETNLRLYRDKDRKIQTSLGADDKNGIWCILNLLMEGFKINFAFCHSEEVGAKGSAQVMLDKEIVDFIADCAYGIIIDRRSDGDIIGYSNKYCILLDDQLETFATENKYKFKCERGAFSDADNISKVLECVNLSCGYYEAHSSKEYTNLNQLWNTYNFCKDMLKKFRYKKASRKRMEEFKRATSYSSTGYHYGGASSSSAYSNSYYTSYAKSSAKDDDYSDYDKDYYGFSKKYDVGSKTQESQKKTTKKETTKITTTTTGNDSIDNPYNLTPNTIASIRLGDTFYDDYLNVYYIPLFTDNTIPKDTGIEDMVFNIIDECPKCTTSVSILQQNIDDLFIEGYDGKEQVLGVCLDCWAVHDLSDTFRSLV